MSTQGVSEQPHTKAEIRTVQQWLDETPHWRDGTPFAGGAMTAMQWRIWFLAAAGKFFEGMIVFMGGVALPLVVREFELSSSAHGFVTAAALAGILVGASLLGGLADALGRKTMFIAEMVIFTIFLLAVCFSPSFTVLIICLFGLGVALGCDYPTAHVMISESISSRSRGRLVLSAFGFQAVGALFGTAVGFLILANDPAIGAWRWMYATAVIPAIVVIVLRFTITETPHWLHLRGRKDEAEEATLTLLKRDPAYPKIVSLPSAATDEGEEPRNASWFSLFNSKNRRATIFASVPWFLQDLGTYGIGIFTPVILAAAVGHQKQAVTVADVIANDMTAARGAAVIDVLLIVGIVFAVILADRVGRIKLQTLGFLGCALGLAIAALAGYVAAPYSTVLIFIGFMLFNFMTNMGPNAQTYLIAGEVFPTEVRAKGAGFAASFAKIGAVSTAFVFPMILAEIGTQVLLWALVGTSLIGAWVTVAFQIETTGKSLEEIGRESEAAPKGPA